MHQVEVCAPWKIEPADNAHKLKLVICNGCQILVWLPFVRTGQQHQSVRNETEARVNGVGQVNMECFVAHELVQKFQKDEF